MVNFGTFHNVISSMTLLQIIWNRNQNFTLCVEPSLMRTLEVPNAFKTVFCQYLDYRPVKGLRHSQICTCV